MAGWEAVAQGAADHFFEDQRPSAPGFCGRPGGSGVVLPPNPPMPIDPNADLIGHRFPVDTGGEGTVLGSASWNPQYVRVDTEAGPTVRVAAQVRRRKELLT